MMTSGFGWTLRSINRITVNSHPWAFLTPAEAWVMTHTHTHACIHRGEDIMMKVMKVYDLGAEINAIVLMTPRKYSIQTGYYCSTGQGQLLLWMKKVINVKVKVQSLYVLIFASPYQYCCLSLAFCPPSSSLLETHWSRAAGISPE